MVLNPRIAACAEELAAENDVIILAVPGYGHKAVLDALAPHIAARHQVIISSHASFGAVYLAEKLAERGVSVPVTAWGTTICTGRRQAGDEVLVNTVRSKVDLCTVPEDRSPEALSLCQALFGTGFSRVTGCWRFRSPISTRRTIWASRSATSPGWSAAKAGARARM